MRPILALAVVLAVAASAGCGGGSGSGSTGTDAVATTPAQTQADTSTTTAPAKPAGPDGAKVFASAGCDGCHTLKAAGSNGNVGPNLDDLKPSFAAVKSQVTNGGGGMPSFGGSLSPAEIDAVATYVAANAGR